MIRSDETTTTDDRVAEFTADERHDLLGDERRRLVLDTLSGRTSTVELAELAAEIAAEEQKRDSANGTTIYQVTLSLHHIHLPKLSDSGVLNYDPDSLRIDPVGINQLDHSIIP